MATFYRLQGSINSAQGPALAGVYVYVCTQPAVTTTVPPSPLATIYSDNAGVNPITQSTTPLQSDGLGNWFFYAATGTYTVVLYDPLQRIPQTVFADQQVVTQGGGSVSSVAMTVPTNEFAIAGSPITTSGTLALTKANINANLVAAGPTSGGAAAWTFRALVSADLPGGVGTVSSITLATNPGSAFTFTVSGTNPITTSGTMTLNLNFANQNANTFLAGPASGGAGAVTARTMVAADMCGVKAVAFSATPVFDPTLFAFPTFTMTLTGDVTSSTCANGTPGQIATFVITQDGTGGHAFAYPAIFQGESNVDNSANAVTVQSFVCITSSSWRARSPGSTNAT